MEVIKTKSHNKKGFATAGWLAGHRLTKTERVTPLIFNFMLEPNRICIQITISDTCSYRLSALTKLYHICGWVSLRVVCTEANQANERIVLQPQQLALPTGSSVTTDVYWFTGKDRVTEWQTHWFISKDRPTGSLVKTVLTGKDRPTGSSVKTDPLVHQ